MQHLIRHTALSLALATASAVAMSLPAQAAQQQKTDTRTYDIEAGQLDQVLTRFAEQSGLRLMVVSELVAGQQSDGLKGNYPVQQGLDRLLLRSGLSARVSDDVILIEKHRRREGRWSWGLRPFRGRGWGDDGKLRLLHHRTCQRRFKNAYQSEGHTAVGVCHHPTGPARPAHC